MLQHNVTAPRARHGYSQLAAQAIPSSNSAEIFSNCAFNSSLDGRYSSYLGEKMLASSGSVSSRQRNRALTMFISW